MWERQREKKPGASCSEWRFIGVTCWAAWKGPTGRPLFLWWEETTTDLPCCQVYMTAIPVQLAGDEMGIILILDGPSVDGNGELNEHKPPPTHKWRTTSRCNTEMAQYCMNNGTIVSWAISVSVCSSVIDGWLAPYFTFSSHRWPVICWYCQTSVNPSHLEHYHWSCPVFKFWLLRFLGSRRK